MGYAINAQGGWRAINSEADLLPGETFSLTEPAQTIVQEQSAQIAALGQACQAAIVSGFPSSVLGSAHQYPSQLTDQQNLLAAVAAANGAASGWQTQLWCASGGVWAFTEHSAAQVQQVNTDWVAFRTKLQAQYAALVAKINAANTVAAVQAITWSMPS